MAAKTIICVGAVVVSDRQILAVRQAPGHSLEGQWTIPWGRLEPGESPSAAALREVSEEAGVIAEITGLIGVQELPKPWLGWNAIIYHCTALPGAPVPDGKETDAAEYLASEQIADGRRVWEPWSLWLAKRALRGDITIVAPADTNPYHPQPGFI